MQQFIKKLSETTINNKIIIDNNSNKKIMSDFDKMKKILNMLKKSIKVLNYSTPNTRKVFIQLR